MKPVKSNSSFEPAPEGNHPAIICGLIDKGTQQPSNADWDANRQIRVMFDLVNEKTEKGKNMIISKDYTFTSTSKGLKSLAKAAAGVAEKDFADFDTEELLGKSVMVEVEHTESKSNGNIYAKVTKTAVVPKGLRVGKSTEPKIVFWLDGGEIDRDVFDKLPERLQTEIATSPEYNEMDKPKKGKASFGRKK